LNEFKDVAKGAIEIIEKEGTSFLRKVKKRQTLTFRRSRLAHPYKM
jgi:hypothetical protein